MQTNVQIDSSTTAHIKHRGHLTIEVSQAEQNNNNNYYENKKEKIPSFLLFSHIKSLIIFLLHDYLDLIKCEVAF